MTEPTEFTCPNCGSENTEPTGDSEVEGYSFTAETVCSDCGAYFARVFSIEHSYNYTRWTNDDESEM